MRTTIAITTAICALASIPIVHCIAVHRHVSTGLIYALVAVLGLLLF